VCAKEQSSVKLKVFPLLQVPRASPQRVPERRKEKDEKKEEEGRKKKKKFFSRSGISLLRQNSDSSKSYAQKGK